MKVAFFDSARPMAITVLGKVIQVVRFPSDSEWADRARALKVLVKQLGRGKSETPDVDSSEVDLALLAKIRDPADTAPVDPYEAMLVLEELGKAEVDDVAPVAGGYQVTLRVAGGSTEHILRMPTAKEIFEHGRGVSRTVNLPYARLQVTINLEASGELYAKLAQSSEGYVGEIGRAHV